jgi:hypothetical protein
MEALFEELNYPSAARLKKVLKERGIDFDSKDVDKLVKGESVRQVQQARPRALGKIWSDDLNDRWFCDLIDMTSSPFKGKQYILVVQDVFSRKMWAEALDNKTSGEVKDAFAKILSESGVKPRTLTSDSGSEFSGEFKAYVESLGIISHQKEKNEPNVIATLDRGIGSLRQALARVARRKSTNDWPSLLSGVVRGQNEGPNEGSYLEGESANKAATDPELQDELREKNKEYVEWNASLIKERREKLMEAGKFRVMIPKPAHFSRGFKPKWEDKVRTVASVEGLFVTDTEGNNFKTKFTLPVESATNDSGPTEMEARGSMRTKRIQKEGLEEFMHALIRQFGNGAVVSLGAVGKFLSARPFRQKTLEVKLNQKAPVKNFIELFPERLKIVTRDGVPFLRILPLSVEGRRRLRRAT